MINNFPNFVKPLADWHSVKTYFRENQILKKLLQEMSVVDINTDYQLFYNLFNQITQINIHYTRKENQLFPS